MPRYQSKPRKKPAYPKVGTGEDFPARRPGSQIGETRSGGKIMQRTRASTSRARFATRQFEAGRIPLAKPRTGSFRATTPRPARPGGERTGYNRSKSTGWV